VLRHSHATRAAVALATGDDSTLELSVTDNGVGFDPDGVVRLGHQGLANTRARAETIGGTVSIVSQPRSKAGTRVSVRVPYRAA
jgi:signal transduction histidine kinase